MFDQAYYGHKAKIMQAIADCDVLLNKRTTAQSEYYQAKGYQHLSYTIAALIGLMIVMPMSFVALRRRIGAPINALREQTRLVASDLDRLTKKIRKISNGEPTHPFRATAQPLRCDSGDEVGELALMQNEMIAGLQDSGGAIARITEGIFRDITERKLAQQALGAAE